MLYAESSAITPSVRFYVHFLHSELTEIKTFTGITLAQSLHVAYVICSGSPSWFETEILQHCENVPNRDTPVSYQTEPNHEFCELLLPILYSNTWDLNKL